MKRNKWIMRLAVPFLFTAGLIGMSASADSSNSSVSASEEKEYDLTVRKNGEDVTFPKGISIEGMNMEGKTVNEAQDFINSYVQTRKDRAITLTVFGDNVFNYNGASFGVAWSNPDAANDLGSYITDGNFIEQYKKQKDLENVPVNIDIQFSYDPGILRGQLQALADNFYAAPINAKATRVPEGFSVTEGLPGRVFDVDYIFNELNAKIMDFDNTEAINYDLPYSEIAPDYTSADFMNYQLLGSYATGNLGKESRVHNIQLSASRVNDTLIYPGQTVSALDLYGPQTAESGYQIAPGYLNGTQVDVYGGGVCQTTTTIYNALIRAEVNVTRRHSHSMLVTYVPPALDAAVATGSKDLVFRNDFHHPIYLESYLSDGNLVVNVWGVDEDPNRMVDFTYEVEAVEWLDPLYNVVVDDTVCTYGGYVNLADKLTAPVETHPRVVATSYKVILTRQEDGSWVETNRTRFNHDVYDPMPGLLYVASDCRVENTATNEKKDNMVYPYLGWTIDHKVMFKNGADWNPATAKDNYEP